MTKKRPKHWNQITHLSRFFWSVNPAKNVILKQPVTVENSKNVTSTDYEKLVACGSFSFVPSTTLHFFLPWFNFMFYYHIKQCIFKADNYLLLLFFWGLWANIFFIGKSTLLFRCHDLPFASEKVFICHVKSLSIILE